MRGSEIAICLSPFDRVVALVEVCSELYIRGYEVASDFGGWTILRDHGSQYELHQQ